MSPYYGPVNETATNIEYERTFVAGDVQSGVGYGIQLALYYTCARFLWRRRKHGLQPKLLLAYITCMLLIESLFVIVQARTVQFIYIDNRNYPGGPWAFFLATQTAAINVIFYATLFLLTFLADLLVLWRCWVIWSASGRQNLAWAAIAFPGLVILASFVMGTLWTLESSQPNLSMYSAEPVSFGTAYYALSLGANIIITLLIIGRLVSYRRTLLESLPPDLAHHYISLATVIVESAALYSVFSLLFLITYAINNPTNQTWLGAASDSQQIASLLIIYRLAEGSAWQKDTLTNPMTESIRFKTMPNLPHVSTVAGGTSFHIAAPPASMLDGSSNPEVKDAEIEIV
ncbi:hypothetical protein DFH07DRAFT_815045 [Mycena maculata]|uniref:Uncharacterized protein n=1 Tax=Mycena maculata TaxID=230809 RepID=A0AAD7NI40_9AGAR|nr:hypothetical protein DFH07DRAFT_815045 [Mycena maculata]